MGQPAGFTYRDIVKRLTALGLEFQKLGGTPSAAHRRSFLGPKEARVHAHICASTSGERRYGVCVTSRRCGQRGSTMLSSGPKPSGPDAAVERVLRNGKRMYVHGFELGLVRHCLEWQTDLARCGDERDG